MNFEDLKENIIGWAVVRNLITENNAKNQLLKSVEEMGELCSAVLKNDTEKAKDGIGDVLVTQIILAETLGLDIVDCLEHAWNEIKDRQGKTVNGTFIKNS